MTRYAAVAAAVVILGVFVASCATAPLASLSDTLASLSGGAR